MNETVEICFDKPSVVYRATTNARQAVPSAWTPDG